MKGLLTSVLVLGCASLTPALHATFGSVSAYSGRAIGMRIDGVVNPPGLNPIVVGDTGELPMRGGVKAATKTKVSIGGGGLTAGTVGSLSTGVFNECVSASAITNFHAEFITEDGDHLTIEADYIGASAAAGGMVAGRLKADAKVVIRGLKINGSPVAVTGQANQVVLVGESRIILNERASATDRKNADVSVAAIHFYTCECIEGWLARVHAGVTVPESANLPRWPDCRG